MANDNENSGAPPEAAESPARAAKAAAAAEKEAAELEAKKAEKAEKGKAARAKNEAAAAAKGSAPKKKKKAASDEPPPVYKRDKPPRLRTIYETEVREKLQKEFNYGNVMQIPGLVKVTVNMGLGRAVQTPKILETAVEELRMITGQGPVVTTAKMDIANFKLRVGHKIGAMVTLRSHHMWEFLDRLINIALPRVRDFKGVSDKAFDGRGNYSLGIKEQIIFPEIDFDAIDSLNGFNVTIVTTANTDDEGRALLRALGMPFRKSGPAAQAA